MRRSGSRRSIDRSPRKSAAALRAGAEVYLLPAVIGSGRGDVEEVLLAGRALARAGHPVQIVRSSTRPLPLLNDPTFDWQGIRRSDRLRPRYARAVTISSQFGITAAEGRDEPLGRAGPWTIERAAIDRAYGPGRVLHVSLEEFARGRPSAELAEERWREAGETVRHRRDRRASGAVRADVAEFAQLYRKFRALDQTNLLTLFPTFERSHAFAREFPETVQSGPLWPDRAIRRQAHRFSREHVVLWYASASTSDRLLPRLVAGLERAGAPVRLVVRTAHPLTLPVSRRVRLELVPSRSPVDWTRAWSRCDLAIVTGTRSLLEAIAWGVPFLYFNGVMGRGRAARRHRPEKIASLLRLLRGAGVPRVLARDLSDFARLRRVEEIIAKRVRGPRAFGPGVRATIAGGFPTPFGDAAEVLVDIVRRFAVPTGSEAELLRGIRQESRRRRAAPRRALLKV
ncbi:MAG: hypothetical protein L3K06_00750 [Thermoplasmata archaeon]|nr:hypothetical protein [Thermoplasmata archaeon]MCI4353878.1 hypothetical protein [Thermoplasmata archaeon]